MSKTKKVIAGCVIFVFIALVYIVVLYGFNKPIKAVTGCYFQGDIEPFDRLCLYEDRRYEQFSLNASGEFESYNSGKWRSYSSQSNGEVIIGVTLSDYFDRFEDNSELDFFPYRNMFNKKLFVTGPINQQRFYVEE